ncbi:MAG TPA: N-acetylmuramoyl-L-alanine amidase [Chthoniobacterales bacterium]|jgi:N-acetylmuramoyl-L-alanine amidase|nr:N-acetylmuramoyl-L-alanine amidase [Chthoniobacterales bacterium]
MWEYRSRIAIGLCVATVTIALSCSAATNSPAPIVVIDAGHGGFDRGGIPGQRVAEKTMTLDVAQRLKSVLAAKGYRVVMTRDEDVFVPLGTRVAVANSYSNAIFVCIHFNSARRIGANGIETYFYNQQSLPLASAIHYYVAGGAPSENRGVRRRGYYVLRHTAVPSVLVECGFLTNPTEAQYAQTVSYRQQLAEEIARGIRASSSVASSSTAARVADSETVPLQPFIDQTKLRDPDISPSKRPKRSSRSRAKHKTSHASRSQDEATANKFNDSGNTKTKDRTPQHLED